MMEELPDMASSFVTITPPSMRAMDSEALAELLRTMTDKPVRATASVAEGCATALQVAGVDGVICAIGSLYMVGDVTAAFKEIFG